MDGWHLTQSQLASLPDPQLAKDRRGAHWTFDPDSYLEFVRNLRVPLSPSRSLSSGLVAEPIVAPSFDHAVKDPDPTGVKIYPWHRIVVVEGLYCFLSIGAWKEAGEMLDERWLATVDFEKATERIVDRHVASGVAGSIEVFLPVKQWSVCVAHGWHRKHSGGQERMTCPVSSLPSEKPWLQTSRWMENRWQIPARQLTGTHQDNRKHSRLSTLGQMIGVRRCCTARMCDV